MDPIASFSGLASGIDFQSLVDQIIQVESRPVTLYQKQIADAQDRSDAWSAFRGKVENLEGLAADLADESAFGTFTTSLTYPSSMGSAPLSAEAGSSAVPGSYGVRVAQLATKEKLGSDVFTSRTTALGIEGEFLVNGTSVRVSAEDSLDAVVQAFNRANAGAGRSGVTASVLYRGSDAYSIVLTSDAEGAKGISLADGTGGALEALGFLDGTTTIGHGTSDGATSSAFSTAGSSVASLLGLTQPPASGPVTIGGLSVALDLSTMSLDDIASAITDAAAAAGSSISASVVSETAEDGNALYRLDISGTTSFTDTNAILQTLGILEGGRSDVAQTVSSSRAFTDGDASTVACAATSLGDLWVDGSSTDVQAGDTLTLSGKRGDGTTFTKTYTVGAGDTLQDLVDALNSATDGFGTGDRTATASISSEGHLVVTDDVAGGSWLSVNVVAHNEGGGSLDFGTFATTSTGRAREITAGRDALLEVDGTYMSRAGNTVTDAIPGVTLRLTSTSDTPVTVNVTQNRKDIAEKVKAFVQAFNDVSTWVSQQFSGAGAEDGVDDPPLAGDTVLRHMRDTLKNAMLTELASSVGGTITRFADIGVEINKKGLFDVDATRLMQALEEDSSIVQRLFGLYGSGSTSALDYVGADSTTKAGTYDVNITQAATQAAAAGAGFGGVYADDGTADVLTIRDLGTGSSYSVSLADGMTLSDIVDALNTELASAQPHEVQATTALYGDASGTAATDATLLQDLHDAGGNALGVADGDVITISGTRANGSAFLQDFQVTDIATQTLGGLRSAIADAVGSGEELAWEDGRLTVSALADGASALSLSVTSDNAGGGALSFGSMEVVTEGRSAVGITASGSTGQLTLSHADYGSAAGFEVSYSAGGADGTAALGLAAGTYTGLDVQGTIGGHAATGSGRILTGGDDTDVEGLMVRYEGADTGAVGSMVFSRGIGSAMETAAELLLGSGEGSIDGLIDNIEPLVTRLNSRIDNLEARLERRRENLIKKFARLEEALAKAQSQSQWLTSQLGNLPSYASGND